MVFSNPEVVRRVNEEFIPVALKAGLVNNPPRGIEGELYTEIARSKPAPQGICTANSAGKVLAWVLSFDDEKSILKFLDHVVERYRQSPDAEQSVSAEQFLKYPSLKLKEVPDTGKRLVIPAQHPHGDRCPARPALERGTLVGRIIGRALDKQGKPSTETTKQEQYMEARVEISVDAQQRLAKAREQAAGKRFHIPNAFARSLVRHAFLGQLDVDPLGVVPGSQNDRAKWEFWGYPVASNRQDILRIRIEGHSDVAGSQDTRLTRTQDGRVWDHRVTLTWQGYVDLNGNRILQLMMFARGDEQLHWGNHRFDGLGGSAVEHLMAGRNIDLHCGVRYGLIAKPCAAEEVVDGAVANPDPQAAPPRTLRVKMQKLQAGIKRLQQSGGNPSAVARAMKNFGSLMQQRKFKEAEALLDQALELVK